MNLDVQNVRLSTKNNELTQLSEQESIVFCKLVEVSNLAQKEDQISLLYRGEKKKSLADKLRKVYGKYDFFKHLFYVGEKAKCYFNQAKNKPEEQDFLISISDVNEKTFKFIFGELNYVLTQKHLENFHRATALKKFKDSNPNFLQFFSQTENEEIFLEKIKRQEEKIKIKIRDYYLHLLHTDQLGDVSFFVSTSTKRSKAKIFATRKKEGGKTKKSVIFYYFLPNPNSRYAVSCLSIQIGYSSCIDLGLPIYSENFYPSQKEVSVKGALFPHFILGVFDLESQLFIANPHIFAPQNSNSVDLVLEQGLIIDQDNFGDFIKGTGYSGYVKRWNETEAYSDTV